MLQIIRHVEEHVLLLRDALESRRIIGELVLVIRGGRVSQQDTRYLAGVILIHGRIVFHDIMVAGIRHKDKLALGERVEDLVEEELAHLERLLGIGEVERSGVERAQWVRLVDELHVGAGDLLGQRGQVVEVDTGRGRGPVCVDIGHVHPWGEGARKGVDDAFFGLIDLGHAQDVVDIGDDAKAFGRDEVGRCVARFGSLGVHVKNLDR